MPSEVDAGADAVSSLIQDSSYFSADGWQAASWVAESLRDDVYVDIVLDAQILVE
jgi:hypothetical protein